MKWFVLISVGVVAISLGLAWADGTTTPAPDQVPPCCAVDQSQKPSGSQPQKPDGDSPELTASVARAGQWTELADRVAFDLDYRMTDQAGRALYLRDLIGSPLALSFIYTRCPDPNMCPAMTLTMAQLQRDLEQAGLGNRVKLVLMTYDPVFDTPERLKAFGQERGLAFTNAMMLQPDADRFREVLSEFQVGVDYRADGSIGHFIELLLIDGQGRFVRDYQGQIWDNMAVLTDLKRLVAEQTPDVDQD